MRQLLFVPAICLLFSVDDVRAVSPPNVADVYAWFDTLELPDVRKLPYVEVKLVAPRNEVGKRPAEAKEYRASIAGFVTAGDKDSVSLFTHDLYRLTIPRSEIVPTADGSLYTPLKIEISAEGLRMRMRLWLKKQADESSRFDDGPQPPKLTSDEFVMLDMFTPTARPPDDPTNTFYCHDLSPEIETLLMAWFCKSLGAEAERRDLERQAAQLPYSNYVIVDRSRPNTLLEDVTSGLELDYYQRMMRSLAWERTSWSEVAAQCEWIARCFPKYAIHGEHTAFFSSVRRLKPTMRPLDECRRFEAEIAAVRKAGGPWKAEHAEYLIYSMRNACGWSEYDMPRALESLILCGDVGLAAMIDHIDDETPTRFVGTGSSGVVLYWLKCSSIGNWMWYAITHDRDLPAEIKPVDSTDPPEARQAVKAKLRAALLKKPIGVSPK